VSCFCDLNPIEFLPDHLANRGFIQRFSAMPQVLPKGFVDHGLIPVSGRIGPGAKSLKDIGVRYGKNGEWIPPPFLKYGLLLIIRFGTVIYLIHLIPLSAFPS